MIDVLKSYLGGHRRWFLLELASLFTLFLVYGLYGILWGPAIYAALLILMMALMVVVRELLEHREHLRELELLRDAQAGNQMKLPTPVDSVERLYQDLLDEAGQRHRQIASQARQTTAEAARYYTLWSHQVKTPLAALRLLLQEEELDRQTMAQELFRMEQYVEMALQFQRLSGDARDLVFEEYLLEKLCKTAVKRVAPLFIHKHISLELSPMDCKVLTDEKWLTFVIEQILTNAVKYTERGKVSIYLEAQATLVIEDTGIGIRAEDLPRVFDWGYTGRNGRLQRSSTGVGLSLCMQAMQLLGHTLSITSELGKGTAVRLGLSRCSIDMY